MLTPLSKLVDLALRTPEIGVVNFNVLHTLLHAMLKKLNIENIEEDIDYDFDIAVNKEDDSEDDKKETKTKFPYNSLFNKVEKLTQQMEYLNALPSNKELFALGMADGERAVSDMWHYIQMKKRVDANESGIDKLMSMMEDLMKEMKGIKNYHAELTDSTTDVRNRIDDLSSSHHESKKKLDHLEKGQNEQVSLAPDDLNQLVTWPILEKAIMGFRKNAQQTPDIVDNSEQKHSTTGKISPTKEGDQMIKQSEGDQMINQSEGPVSGTMLSSGAVSGTKPSAGPVSGTKQSERPVSGGMPSAGPVSGTKQSERPISGTKASAGVVSGTKQSERPISGTKASPVVSGTKQSERPISGTNQSERPISGTKASAGVVSGTKQSERRASGTIPVVGVVYGAQPSDKPVSGTKPSAEGVSGTKPSKGHVSKGVFMGVIPPGEIDSEGGRSETMQPKRGGSKASTSSDECTSPVHSHDPQNISSSPGPSNQFLECLDALGQLGNSHDELAIKLESVLADVDINQKKFGEIEKVVNVVHTNEKRFEDIEKDVEELKNTFDQPELQNLNELLSELYDLKSDLEELKLDKHSTSPTSSKHRLSKTPTNSNISIKSPNSKCVLPPIPCSGSNIDSDLNAEVLSKSKSELIHLVLSKLSDSETFQEMLGGFGDLEQKVDLLYQKIICGDSTSQQPGTDAKPSKGQQEQKEAYKGQQEQKEAYKSQQEQKEASRDQQEQKEASRDQQEQKEASRDQQEQKEASRDQQEQKEASRGQQEQKEASRDQQEQKEASRGQQEQKEASRDQQEQQEGSEDQVGKKGKSLEERRVKDKLQDQEKDFKRTNQSLKDQMMELVSKIDEQLNCLNDKICELDDNQKKLGQAVAYSSMGNKPAGAAAGAPNIDNASTRRLQEAMKKMQHQIEKLHHTTEDLLEENNQKTQDLQNLLDYCNTFQDKADKDYVALEIGVKADKRQLEKKVSHTLFDTKTNEINKMIKEILDKLSENEDSYKALASNIDHKLDRMELPPLKKWLESRLRMLNKKIHQSTEELEEDAAAGLRKQLLMRFHCLSCDRPVEIMPTAAVNTLPQQPGLPTRKTSRPYSIYEMEQMRQNAKSMVGKNPQNLDKAVEEKETARFRNSDFRTHLYDMLTLKHHQKETGFTMADLAACFATVRQCGGPHTATYLKPFSGTGFLPFKMKEEVDVQGVDGHIYKGASERIQVEGKMPTSFMQTKQQKQVLPHPPPAPARRPLSAPKRRTSPRPRSGENTDGTLSPGGLNRREISYPDSEQQDSNAVSPVPENEQASHAIPHTHPESEQNSQTITRPTLGPFGPPSS